MALISSSSNRSTRQKILITLLILPVLFSGCAVESSPPTAPIPAAASQTPPAQASSSGENLEQATQHIPMETSPVAETEGTQEPFACKTEQFLMVLLPEENPQRLLLLDPEAKSSTTSPIPEDYRVEGLSSAYDLNNNLLLMVKLQGENPTQVAVFDMVKKAVIEEIPIDATERLEYEKTYQEFLNSISQEMIKKGLGAWALAEAFKDSLAGAWWAADGKSFYYANSALDGYTHLYHYTIESQTSEQLENDTFFVEELLPSPGGQWGLLRKGVNPAFASPSLTNFYLLQDDGKLAAITLPRVAGNAYWKAGWQDETHILFEAYDSIRLNYVTLLRYDTGSNAITRIWGQPYHYWVDLGEQQVFLYLGINKSRLTVVENETILKDTYLPAMCTNLEKPAAEDLLVLTSCRDENQTQYALNNSFELVKDPKLPAGSVFSASPDKQWFVLLPEDQAGPMEISVNGANEIWQAELDTLRRVYWVPDGSAVIFESSSGYQLMDLADGSITNLGNLELPAFGVVDAVWTRPFNAAD